MQQDQKIWQLLWGQPITQSMTARGQSQLSDSALAVTCLASQQLG